MIFSYFDRQQFNLISWSIQVTEKKQEAAAMAINKIIIASPRRLSH